MILGYQRAFVDPEGVRHDVLKVEWVVVLGFPKACDAYKVFNAKHAEVLVEIRKIPLEGAVIKVRTGIVGAIDTQIMVGIVLQISQGRKENGREYFGIIGMGKFGLIVNFAFGILWPKGEVVYIGQEGMSLVTDLDN